MTIDTKSTARLLRMLTTAAVTGSFSMMAVAGTTADTANDTIFGPNVYVFDSGMSQSAIQKVASTIFGQQETNQFGDERKALLFRPGDYDLGFHVGFYTSVAGLGLNPSDTRIGGDSVNVDAKWDNGNATQNFWRSIENITLNPSDSSTRWAVSQAAPMRRLQIEGELDLFDFDDHYNAGWASGGYLVDSMVAGEIVPASQQQWFARNNSYEQWSNGVWNMVFVGDQNPPSGDFPDPPYTRVDNTPVTSNKPYLYASGNSYAVFVPAFQTNTQGVSWSNSSTPGRSIGIDQFYIAKPGQDDAASINAALRQGKNLVLTPGIYRLQGAIEVNRADTVVLGIGYPTLEPDSGQAALKVGDVGGVSVSGVLIDAGAQSSPTLMQIGPKNSSASHINDPTSIHDIFFRVGGAHVGRAHTSLEVNSNDVIGNDIWAWRADHGQGVGWDTNTAANGVVVNGDNATMYGLFVEHYQEYQTLWNGNGGRTYFYQSEDPYDVPDQAAWKSHGDSVNGYASYKVADTVTSHEAYGLGIYSYFRDAPVVQRSAIEVPDKSGIKIEHATTIWLNGEDGSRIDHIINDAVGGSVYGSSPESAMRQTVVSYHDAGDANTNDLALNRPVSATSVQSDAFPASNAVDGKDDTRWSSQASDPQSLTVDLGSSRRLSRVKLHWEAAYGKRYTIDVSDDGSSWRTVKAVTDGDGDFDAVDLPADTSGRYVRMSGQERGTPYGYSLWSFSVF